MIVVIFTAHTLRSPFHLYDKYEKYLTFYKTVLRKKQKVHSFFQLIENFSDGWSSGACLAHRLSFCLLNILVMR